MKNLKKRPTSFKSNRKSSEKAPAPTSKNNNLFFEMIIEGLNNLEQSQWEHYLKRDLDFIPKNAFSQKVYKGINRLALYLNMIVNEFETPFYATFKQITTAGGKIRKGAKSVVIQYFNYEVKHKESDIKISISEYSLLSENAKKDYEVRTYLKLYRVFNIHHIENIEEINLSVSSQDEEPEEVFNDVESAEILINNLISNKGLNLQFKKADVASYSPSLDKVNMPYKELFKDEIKYYSTLFHELIHWTGNPTRLNRFEVGKQSKDRYAYEELIAEMGAMLMYFDYEMAEEFNNSLVYLKGWTKSTNKNEDQADTLKNAFMESKRAVNFIYS